MSKLSYCRYLVVLFFCVVIVACGGGGASSDNGGDKSQEVVMDTSDGGIANGATGVPLDPTIVLKFNTTMNPATVNDTTVFLSTTPSITNSSVRLSVKGLNLQATISDITASQNNTVFSFVPVYELDPATKYYIILTNGIKTASGASIKPVVFNFTTEDGGDTPIPTSVRIYTPVNGATSTSILPLIKFTTPLESSIEPRFALHQGSINGPLVEVNLVYYGDYSRDDEPLSVYHATPKGNLDANTTYFAVITDGTEADTRPAVSRFTTGTAFLASNVRAGNYNACGQSLSGVSYCWGSEIGTQDPYSSIIPSVIPLQNGVSSYNSIVGGNYGGCSVANTGKAYCWGWGNNLGDGTNDVSYTPVAVSGNHSFQSLSIGVSSTCGIDNSGAAYCWGGNLGNGTEGSYSNVPVAVTLPFGVSSFRSISVGEMSSCAVANTGEAYCWGLNTYGQLGNGTINNGESVPVKVSLPEGVTSFRSVSTSGFLACGIADDGMAYCWGKNDLGQLGNVNYTNESSGKPIEVTLPDGVSSFSSVSVGKKNACAIANTGVGYCWGSNWDGNFGNGTYDSSRTPVAITFPIGVSSWKSLSSGFGVLSFTCGIANTDVLYCWGSNDGGNLGIGGRNSLNFFSYPMAVVNPNS